MSNLDSFSKKFEQELTSLIPQFQQEKLTLAVSGGADSMCLTLLCHHILNINQFNVVIVDHALRKNSVNEALQTKSFLQQHNIKSEILTWCGARPVSNIQNFARELRYKLLIDYCKENASNYLLTAHTEDDQAETVFMRVLRGAGIDGLSGIPKENTIDSVNIIRPLLSFKRSEIEVYLKEHNWQWLEDPSNQNTIFDRVKVRKYFNILSQDFPEVKQRLSLLAINMNRAKQYLNTQTKQVFESIIQYQPQGYATLNIEGFVNLDEEIALRSLKKVLLGVGRAQEIRLERLQNLYQELKHSIKTKTLGNCVIHDFKGVYLIYPEIVKLPAPCKIKSGATCIWGNFKIKNNGADAIIQPLGESGWINFKNQNIISQKHNLKSLIYTYPCLYSPLDSQYRCSFLEKDGDNECEFIMPS